MHILFMIPILSTTLLWFHNRWSCLWRRISDSMLIHVRLKIWDTYASTTSTDTIIKWYILTYLNILGTTIGYIFWVRNRKWCWYILFWAVGVILANPYIIYICINNMHGTPRKHRWSHHDFRKSIQRAWINPEKYSAEEFEVQPEIPDNRRKIKLILSSSC